MRHCEVEKGVNAGPEMQKAVNAVNAFMLLLCTVVLFFGQCTSICSCAAVHFWLCTRRNCADELTFRLYTSTNCAAVLTFWLCTSTDCAAVLALWLCTSTDCGAVKNFGCA